MPDSFAVPNYPPELNYYLAEILHMLDDDIEFSSDQIKLLFDQNMDNYQSLIQPINLHFFYEKYLQGNYDSIRKRFSNSLKNAP